MQKSLSFTLIQYILQLKDISQNYLGKACLQCRRHRFNPGSGRSPGEGNGNPLQDSRLENSMDRGAWRATVHGAADSQIGLSDQARSTVPRILCLPA